MIERYQAPYIQFLLLPEQVYKRWLLIEVEVMGQQLEAGILPQTARTFINQARALGWTPELTERARHYEKHVRHDVVAFLQAVTQQLAHHTNYRETPLHLGLTSSNLVDTGNALAWRQAVAHLWHLDRDLVFGLERLMRQSGQLWISGRTHGEIAAPVQWGHRIGQWLHQLRRAQIQMQDAPTAGSLAGPVGTWSKWLPPEVESKVLDSLGLETVRSSQIVPRDLQLTFAQAMLAHITAIERIATDLRLAVLVGDAELRRPDGTVGSSSMPGKVNPVELEQLCGLARVARGHVNSLSESVVSWLERDITASSVDRTAMVDLAHLTAYTATKMARILHNEITLLGNETPDGLPDVHADACEQQHKLLWESQ